MTRYSFRAEVRARPGVADPEGLAIERALPALGFGGVGEVSVGKAIRFTVEASDAAEARAVAGELCERLLANPVIERFELCGLEEPGAVATRPAAAAAPPAAAAAQPASGGGAQR
jgi:phosphoribosylformylglycinamidine synthase PurS subunit